MPEEPVQPDHNQLDVMTERGSDLRIRSHLGLLSLSALNFPT